MYYYRAHEFNQIHRNKHFRHLFLVFIHYLNHSGEKDVLISEELSKITNYLNPCKISKNNKKIYNQFKMSTEKSIEYQREMEGLYQRIICEEKN
mmetsp:Transcript_20732/g.23089  ORF Transcript_20732/g.23089 Transcript_20732/m.23089 type:complete len:94 (-) Transcript_20732:23-304(-)